MTQLVDWFTNGKKMVIGGLLLAAGLVWQNVILHGEKLAVVPCLLIFAGLISFINVFYSRKDHENVNYLFFIFGNVILASISFNIIPMFEDGVTMLGVIFILVIVMWIMHYFLIFRENRIRQILASLGCSLINSGLLFIIIFVAAMFPYFYDRVFSHWFS